MLAYRICFWFDFKIKITRKKMSRFSISFKGQAKYQLSFKIFTSIPCYEINQASKSERRHSNADMDFHKIISSEI